MVNFGILEWGLAASFIIGIAILLYLLLRDPLDTFYAFLRSLKPSVDNFELLIILSPIWIPIWILDKVFKLNIYYKNLEDISIAEKFNPSQFRFFVLSDTNDEDFVESKIIAFEEEFNLLNSPILYRSKLFNNELMVSFNSSLSFSEIKLFISFLDASSPIDAVNRVKGIFIHKTQYKKSFFVCIQSEYSGKLVGKTAKNKKVYLELDLKEAVDMNVYFNRDLGYIKNIDFKSISSFVKINF